MKRSSFENSASSGMAYEKHRNSVSFAVALLLICAIALYGCSIPGMGGRAVNPGAAENPPAPTVSQPESYADVYEALKSATPSYGSGGDMLLLEEAPAAGEIEGNASPKNSDSSAESTASDAGSGSYSETNVQVEGVDEGDIVKTDGKNIYLVSGTDIVISQAAGQDTKEISRISFANSQLLHSQDEPIYIYPSELYVSGNTLAVLYSYSYSYANPADSSMQDGGASEGSTTEDGESSSDSSSSSSEALTEDSSTYYYPYLYKSVAEVALFDISDASNPTHITSFAQDGYYSSSRMQDGILYLISSAYVNTYDLDPDHPENFVPLFYSEDATTLAEAKNICILPDIDSATYTVVSSISLPDAAAIDEYSVLGGNSTAYMSPENLYLASSSYEENETNSYQDGSFTVTEYETGYTTRIAKLGLDQGTITYRAETSLPGNLLNQFSLDEYDGYLRAVTTTDNWSYRILDDGKGEIRDYDNSAGDLSTNSLFVLDASLQKTGSIEGLAEDERVYSVRFDGPVGYFVTFKQVDPLFAVDLSNPSDPQIKSELKIPGFSTYMHPYAEDRLFGLGMAADENGRTQGMKMSMFDTGNAYDITEKHLRSLDSDYSSALYNHKAILISQENDIIGIPVENGYAIYGYSDEDGFYLRQQIENLSDEEYYYYSDNRGLYIDDYLYICSPSLIAVYTLDDLQPVSLVHIEVKEPDYGVVRPLSSPSSGSAGAVE